MTDADKIMSPQHFAAIPQKSGSESRLIQKYGFESQITFVWGKTPWRRFALHEHSLGIIGPIAAANNSWRSCFCRAMHRPTATMLSQDVCPSVCTSVRPSVTHRYWVETANIKLYSPIFRRRPSNRGVEYMWVWRNSDFRPISRYISEMTEHRTTVTAIYWMAPFPMNLSPWVISNPDFDIIQR